MSLANKQSCLQILGVELRPNVAQRSCYFFARSDGMADGMLTDALGICSACRCPGLEGMR